jgi:parallel beta-helix repeat protein
VDDLKDDCPEAQFNTIQQAVTAAAIMPGMETIRVCPGTYPENVLIGTGNSLELRGSGIANTFVTGVSGTPGPIIDVDNAGVVSISRLTVDGRSLLAGGVVWGIRYDETDGKIQKVAVRNIRDSSGASQGLCIRIQSSGLEMELTVRDTITDNCTRANIIANGLGVEAVIEHNSVTGPVAPKVWAPNGIQVSRGAEARVANNDVSGMTSPSPPAGAGSGIILFCAGPTTVRSNGVSESDLGIALGDNAGATVSRNRVEDSVFDAYSLQFIGTLFGDLGCPVFPSPTTNHVLSDNRARDSGEYGISLASFDPADPVPPSDNTISKNDIRGSGIDGIHVFDGRDNQFLGNRIRDSATVDPTGVDAEDDTTGTRTAGTANTCGTTDARLPTRTVCAGGIPTRTRIGIRSARRRKRRIPRTLRTMSW